MAKDISYTDALNELNEIAREIENESIAVDELSVKLKRASELITLCRAKLRLTEEEVKKIIGEMGEPS
jgi:exodeoxyribonuclease VII small subunit